jgi:hypothetical protein
MCPERNRLLNHLVSALREQSHAAGEMAGLRGQGAEFASSNERVNEAAKATQEAWTAYQAHIDEHGCLWQ